mgnify:CR=1 FL=1
MPSRDDILQALIDRLQPLANPGVTVEEETNLVETLGLDSQRVLDLLLDLEDDFDVLVPMEALVDVQTVGELATVIHTRSQES